MINDWVRAGLLCFDECPGRITVCCIEIFRSLLLSYVDLPVPIIPFDGNTSSTNERNIARNGGIVALVLTKTSEEEEKREPGRVLGENTTGRPDEGVWGKYRVRYL